MKTQSQPVQKHFDTNFILYREKQARVSLSPLPLYIFDSSFFLDALLASKDFPGMRQQKKKV